MNARPKPRIGQRCCFLPYTNITNPTPPGISDSSISEGSSDIPSIIRLLYSADLAFVHDAGFGELAQRSAPDIVRILRARGIARGHVVELGCGSGITARHLTDRGYAVTGIDVSRAMIRLARA